MANQKVLEEYLIGNNKDIKGYLRSDDNNGKVIMLSGKWGSGKTHFWQEKIATDKLKKELKNEEKSYSYISLYGKSSIEEIENDIFGQVYIDAIGGDNFVRKGFSTFTKIMGRYGLSKIGNGLDEEQKENIERVALKKLSNGGIICFDDFERKSKEIDLNDLFGFITQLSLNFECKIVIILNDDVFEGKEKDIFSNVKEKTVSKYLYYNPSIEELFNLIFDSEEKYKDLEEHRELILKTIEETEELNARIYIQVLDNLLEWVENTNENMHETTILRYLILGNLNFILNHTLLKIIDNYLIFEELTTIKSNIERLYNYCEQFKGKNLSEKIIIEQMVNNEERNKVFIEFINKNKNLIEIFYFYRFKLNMICFLDSLEKINNFIETGILIKDDNK